MIVLVRRLQRRESRLGDRLACYGMKGMFMTYVGTLYDGNGVRGYDSLRGLEPAFSVNVVS